MKTIGMLGGMSWQSTASYYKAINESVGARLGGLHSAKICLYSVDFDDIEQLQRQGNWEKTAAILSAAAQRIEAAGADFLVICTNTMHKVAPQIESAISIDVLHIADATAEKLRIDGIKKVGLLGTRFTMEQDFYKQRITDKFGIEVMVPGPDAQAIVHNIIYSQLCRGIILNESRQQYINIIDQLHANGADAIILGCTEIALLVQQVHTRMPLYDTTAIHADAAVSLSLGG